MRAAAYTIPQGALMLTPNLDVYMLDSRSANFASAGYRALLYGDAKSSCAHATLVQFMLLIIDYYHV
jgi:hypothetical protein